MVNPVDFNNPKGAACPQRTSLRGSIKHNFLSQLWLKTLIRVKSSLCSLFSATITLSDMKNTPGSRCCWQIFGRENTNRTQLHSAVHTGDMIFCVISTEEVDGYWSCWGPWSRCTASMKRHRTRRCNNPAPIRGGQPCEGPDKQEEPCYISIFAK